MEQIDYKKKYEDLINKLNDAKKTKGGYTFKSVIDEIVPENVESKDERVRKCLLSHFSRYQEDEIFLNGITMKQIVSWLEKQGEQKPTDKTEPKFKVGDWVVQENIGVYKIIEICEFRYEVYERNELMIGNLVHSCIHEV